MRGETIRRTLVVVAAVVGFAAAASATTLSVVSDKTTYNAGDTITLSISGDAQGATAYGIFGRLQYTGTGAVTASTQTQKRVNPSWDASVPLLNGAGYSEAFDQIAGFPASMATNLPAQNPFSTVTLIAQAAGVVNVNWNSVASSGFELMFFGLTSAPGTTFTIFGSLPPPGPGGGPGGPPGPGIPEPATVALLGLGLLGLAGWRRGRA
jgi:hypothetical protein